MSKKKLPKEQDVPETKRILPKTPNRARTEMSTAENVVQGNKSEADTRKK